ncbi:VOC family protein [Rhodococcus jostii]|uniref:VOC family protein n=1 Tax=Rhodococcus jostii TaxID=132919 RepID=UPI0002EB86F4|nr:VOC family protein [Rhodococcus jostii]
MSLTAIRVADLQRSVEFYTAGCGFALEREFSTDLFDAMILRAGTAGIELLRPRDAAAAPDHGNMFAKMVVNTRDVDGLVALACAHGGTAEMPVTELEAFGGMVVGSVRDPDGHLIEVVGRR